MVIADLRETILKALQIRHLNLYLFHGIDGLGWCFRSPGRCVSLSSFNYLHIYHEFILILL